MGTKSRSIQPHVTPDEYCREIEAYLCRKNDGHLIRIVGPSFERVSGWASQGIPLKIAFQGIDAYFVRYYAKGPRRRPVQIDFCDADVLDAFDRWRRAVGVRLPGGDATSGEQVKQHKRGLREHLHSVVERITARLASPAPIPPALMPVLEDVANQVSALSEQRGPIRGEARIRARTVLAELDRRMIEAVRCHSGETALQMLRLEAAVELAPFKERMPSEIYEQALNAAVDRLLRNRERLPVVSLD